MSNLIDELKFIPINDIINDSDWLKSIDLNCSSFNDKLHMVIEAVKCPAEYLQLFAELINLLKSKLKKNLRKRSVRIYGFGSFVTGLALKNADLDMCVEVDPTFPTSLQTLKNIKNILFRQCYRSIFSQIILITAKVPILKCEHILRFHCDISVDNVTALYNSQLIKYYLSLDSRFQNLCLIIKLWAKRCGASSQNGFKSYTIILMVIFYLQQVELMPSVKMLQTQVPPRLIDGWNTAFPITPTKVVDNDISLLDLLRGFFNFYATFEFAFYIVSPYLGEPIIKSHLNKITDEEKKMQCHSYVCVQDVFQHNFNTSVAANRESVICFQSSCLRICECNITEQTPVEQLFILEPRKTKKSRKNRNLDINTKVNLRPSSDKICGETLEEMRSSWIALALATIKEILVCLALGTILIESEGFIKCQIATKFYDAALRATTTELLLAENEDFKTKHQIDRYRDISLRLRSIPEAQLNPPNELLILYEITKLPTSLNLTFKVPKDEVAPIEMETIRGVKMLLNQFSNFIERGTTMPKLN